MTIDIPFTVRTRVEQAFAIQAKWPITDADVEAVARDCDVPVMVAWRVLEDSLEGWNPNVKAKR